MQANTIFFKRSEISTMAAFVAEIFIKGVTFMIEETGDGWWVRLTGY